MSGKGRIASAICGTDYTAFSINLDINEHSQSYITLILGG